jgi:hypothetical protein
MQTDQFLYTQLPHKEGYSYYIDYLEHTFIWYLSQSQNIRHTVAFTESSIRLAKSYRQV